MNATPLDMRPLVPVSVVDRMVWPALPSAEAATRLALLQQLEHSQWWPPTVLRDWQFRQIGVLLEHAIRTVPFYGERLRAAGVEPGKRVEPGVWARIPVLTREDLQRAGTALHSQQVPRGHGPVRGFSSSGSTGRPIRAFGTRISRLFWDVFTLRDHIWQGRDLRGTLAGIREFGAGAADYPEGVRIPDWGPAVAQVYPSGPAIALSIYATSDQQAEWLRRKDPDYLVIYPTALHAVLQLHERERVRLPRLREVRTISEVLDPETRELCRRVWGVPVSDVYTARETGYMALQCPEHGHLHVQAEGLLMEVLKDDGTPCAPGEAGRVVVTVLHNFAMPLIRYEVGDLAEVGAPCPCGRGLPVLTRVMGRVRNMLRLPDGRQVWPHLGVRDLYKVAPFRQIQVVQTALDRLDVRLVLEHPLTEAEAATLRETIQRHIGHTFDVALSCHDEIPRGPAGKYEAFKCEIAGAEPR